MISARGTHGQKTFVQDNGDFINRMLGANRATPAHLVQPEAEAKPAKKRKSNGTKPARGAKN